MSAPWPLAKILEHFATAPDDASCRVCEQPGAEILLSGGEPVHVRCHRSLADEATHDVMDQAITERGRRQLA